MTRITLKDGTDWPLNTAFNGDCLEFMQSLPDKCIDLVLTDPPYGIGADKKHSEPVKQSKHSATESTGFKNKEWDSVIPEDDVFNEIFRISKHQIIWGVNYFTDKRMRGGRIYWDKCVTMPTYSDGEIAFCSKLNSIIYFKHAWHGMLQQNMKNKEVRIHPTQKPLRLFKWCLEKYAPENAIVFDPFLGSFTTAIACHNYKLNWLGCEKDPDYFKAGFNRYNQEKEQILMEFDQ